MPTPRKPTAPDKALLNEERKPVYKHIEERIAYLESLPPEEKAAAHTEIAELKGELAARKSQVSKPLPTP